jgi:hypothetical protein
VSVYRKVGALIVRDRHMLLITATAAAPDEVFSMPGGPERGDHQTALAEDLQAELGLTLTRSELFGEWEVTSAIDGQLVHSWIYRTWVTGEPDLPPPGRRCGWVGPTSPLRLSTTAAAVRDEAIQRGVFAPSADWSSWSLDPDRRA